VRIEWPCAGKHDVGLKEANAFGKGTGIPALLDEPPNARSAVQPLAQTDSVHLKARRIVLASLERHARFPHAPSMEIQDVMASRGKLASQLGGKRVSPVIVQYDPQSFVAHGDAQSALRSADRTTSPM
jgi:hypothetical protein